MMNTWTHAFATLSLALMALIIHIMMRSQNTVKALDDTRLYSMVRFRGDVDAAKSLLSSETAWLSDACRPSVSQTLPTTNTCVEERRRLRNGILNAMGCFSYGSQVCSYLRNITAGIIQNRTVLGTPSAIGRDLSGTSTIAGGITYRQLLLDAIDKAPVLFYNSYRAEAPEYFIARSVLYTIVIFAILGNLLVHILDHSWRDMTWFVRLTTRLSVFAVLVFLIPLILMGIAGVNSFFVVMLGIWLPSLIVLLYYEMFLDPTITRPW